MIPDIQTKIDDWLKLCQELVDNQINQTTKSYRVTLRKDGNPRKYQRIVSEYLPNPNSNYRGSKSTHAWAFINLDTGDVLLPKSWDSPAKHPRGNLYDQQNGMSMITSWTGPQYLQ